ncbi:MAG: DNA topoisomerase [Lachnospiraceae bacterium]|nr:DNA topoisomerase [Lachnospiraceae bacterium]
MKLVVCEKPSVAQDFAATLGVQGRHDGYIENDEYIITWCVGHLVTLCYPEEYDPGLKEWKLETLPFLPAQYRYEIIKDVKKQYEIVKKLLNRPDVDVIYNAGDAGREGEYIQRLVQQTAGYNRKAKMMRIWIDSQTQDEIRRGIRDAKDASCYDRLADSAYMRAIEDYAIGINFSRALSCKFGYEYNQKIKSDKYKPLSVGRVMTCVLGMIVDRERQIRAFKPTDFYKIKADTGFESLWKAVETSHLYENPILYNETGFKTQRAAEQFIAGLQKKPRLKVESVVKKMEKKNAPQLFNLAELQNECSKRFKISPDKTLEVAQKLYEQKLTTYPRTDARVLSTAVAKEIDKNIRGLTKYSYKNDVAENILSNGWYKGISSSKYCDDSKITDHYAIIPTGVTDDSGLNDIELSVFHLIIERFLSIFYPGAVYEKVDVVLLHQSKERFFTSEKVLKSPGYLEIVGYEKEKQSGVLGNIAEGDILDAEYSISKGQTSAPSRYTSGNIILAMENAGNLIEDEELRAQIKGSGIGTSATRAETIKKLVKIGYICLNQKTQVITPHTDGELLYDIINDNIPSLLSPKMTASWEKGLAQIERGEVSKEQYQEKLNDYVRKSVEGIKSKQAKQGEPDESFGVILGTCPLCKGDIVTTRFGCGCSNYKEKGCWFSLPSFALKQMDNEQLDKLITKGKTDVINNLVAKNGKKFAASFYIDHEEKKIQMLFPGGSMEKEDTTFICPRAKCKKAGKMMKKTGSRLSCECGFSMYTTICGKELEDDEIEQILAGETIYVKGLVSQKGKKFDANVRMKRDGKLDMSFD